MKVTNYPIKNVRVNPQTNVFLKNVLNLCTLLNFFNDLLNISKATIVKIISNHISILPWFFKNYYKNLLID